MRLENMTPKQKRSVWGYCETCKELVPLIVGQVSILLEPHKPAQWEMLVECTQCDNRWKILTQKPEYDTNRRWE